MLIVVSPAKTLDFESTPVTATHTQPDFLEHSATLITTLRQLSALDLAELMKISMSLAELNFERYYQWCPPFGPDNAKQAALAFKGDVYTGLDAQSLDEADLAFAQQHLRILSGLYGLLRPLDLIQAYRLEMGTRLKNPRGNNLYQFWGDIITDAINTQLRAQGDDILVNLASNEYFRAVQAKRLAGRIITPEFKELKDDGYRMIGFYAKRARGMMSRFVIRERLTDVEGLKDFGAGGYHYNPQLSGPTNWVFTRDMPA